MHRCNKDESNFTDAQKIAWNHVLPYQHLCIVDYDEEKVRELVIMLNKTFSRQALAAAVKRLHL
jgi:hypothetical protein